jgi:hypothetical protein
MWTTYVLCFKKSYRSKQSPNRGKTHPIWSHGPKIKLFQNGFSFRKFLIHTFIVPKSILCFSYVEKIFTN